MVSVFMPCTPNPTTGFFFYIAADEVIELPITADEAAKLIMSAGLIQPEGPAALAAMAEAAKLEKAEARVGASDFLRCYIRQAMLMRPMAARKKAAAGPRFAAIRRRRLSKDTL